MQQVEHTQAKPGSRTDRLHQTQQLLLILKSKGFNYEWTARQLHVSRGLVSMWRRGKAVPRAEHVESLKRLAQNILIRR
jgi:hypothetical protein